MWCILVDERSSINAALSLIFKETPEEIAQELIERCELAAENLLSDYSEYDIDTIEDMADLLAQYQETEEDDDDDEDDEEWDDDEEEDEDDEDDEDDLSFIADEVACCADDYLKLLHPDGSIEKAISNFYFEFGDCTEETSVAASSYAEFVVAFNEYIKTVRALSDWRMVPGIPEDEVDWEAVDREIRSITGQKGFLTSAEEEKLKYLRRG